ncbi:MAG: RNHCP domain-containing protein [Phycisphaeraceae bacterium]
MSSRNKRRHNDDGFTCIRCRMHVSGDPRGSRHRNHCPLCLWSRHVDEAIGDRQATCRAPMEPIAIHTRDDGEWCLIHRCTACNTFRTNRIAGDDQELALLQLALRPLARPPFPLDHLPIAGRPRGHP